MQQGNSVIATAYFTICARNYLAYALSLGESLRRNGSNPAFFICLADDDTGTDDLGEMIVPLSRLPLPRLDEMRFRYSVMEFATAIKPACFQHFLEERGFDAAVYLDPDISVFAPLSEVESALASGASSVLTPHILSPLSNDARPNDLDIMRSGVFNLGFAAFARTAEALSYLGWWARHLESHCLDDLENGLFVDQKFMDFAPAFLPGLLVLRNPGYNVAYWNLSQRPVEKSADGLLTAGGTPLVFFHFSGVIPGDDSVFSRHQDRFTMQTAGPAADLVRDYLGQLAANGHARWSALPYAYDRFESGDPILAPMRRAWKAEPGAANPFSDPQKAWWNAPSPDIDQDADAPITRLMFALHQSRPDLRAEFPFSLKSGRRGFHDWFLVNGSREYRLAGPRPSAFARFLARLRLALGRRLPRN